MKLPPFASEFDPSELPAIAEGSRPLENARLDEAAEALPSEERIKEALALIQAAVYHYYFAKGLDGKLGELRRAARGPLASALDVMRTAVVKHAVIAIAMTIDETTGRTRSLPHALKALERRLEASPADPSDGETDATIQLIRHILTTTNPDKVKSLLYVRHIRNKWAGHASWDLSVDTWPTGDKMLNYPLLEDGLVRMVNAFDEFSRLVQMSPYLQTLQEASRPRIVNPDGTETSRMTISWDAAVPLAEVMRRNAQESARHLLDRLQ
jgi:hypothetical protein